MADDADLAANSEAIRRTKPLLQRVNGFSGRQVRMSLKVIMQKIRSALVRPLVLVLCLTLTSSCTTTDMHQAGAAHGTEIGCASGALLGALAGAVIGQQLHNRNAGLAVGGIAGLGVGCYVGSRWQQREKALQELAKRENLQIQTENLAVASQTASQASYQPPPAQRSVAPSNQQPPVQQVGLVASVQSTGMFDTNSNKLTPDGLRQARELAQIYRPQAAAQSGAGPQHADRSALLVIGHTDATGPAAYNQELSEQRAHAMGAILAEAGIDPNRVYYQGVGSSRPVADNSMSEGRAKNRRVEIVELDSTDLLRQRVLQESSNPRYLAHGASTAARTPAPSQIPDAQLPPDFIDFGGQPSASDTYDLSAYIKPKHSGFSLISSANAAPVAAQSCQLDSPRLSGPARNLATNQPLDAHETRDFLPDMNGRAWAGLVNGNLVTVTPVAVLRDGARIAQDPTTFVTAHYTDGAREASKPMPSTANAYEGEDSILYRVFVHFEKAPLECYDVVIPKSGNGVATAGKLFYDRAGTPFVSTFQPRRS